MYRNVLAIIVLFVFHGVFAEDKSNDLILVESETKLKGWRFHNNCSGSNSYFSYEWDYYSPPPRKDLGGYGIVKIKHANIEYTYSGFDLYPHKSASGCGTILGKSTLVLETEDWSASKKYVLSINVDRNVKKVYQYKLKKTVAHIARISEDAYLVAGFGVCEKDGSGSWSYDVFCENIDKANLELAEKYLQSKVGLRLSPSILGVGEGAFRYYIICDECDSSKSLDVGFYLKEYLEEIVKKIKTIKKGGDEKHLYNSLLAFESVSLVSRQAMDRISLSGVQDKDDRSVVATVEYQNYWKMIFNEN